MLKLINCKFKKQQNINKKGDDVIKKLVGHLTFEFDYSELYDYYYSDNNRSSPTDRVLALVTSKIAEEIYPDVKAEIVKNKRFTNEIVNEVRLVVAKKLIAQ